MGVDQVAESLQFNSLSLSDKMMDPSSFYSTWSLDTTLDKQVSSAGDILSNFGRSFPNLDSQALDKSASSDKFGLNSSNSSTGFGGLDEFVSKILEDDQSIFNHNGLYSGELTDDSQSHSDVFSFDGYVIVWLFILCLK